MGLSSVYPLKFNEATPTPVLRQNKVVPACTFLLSYA